MILYAFFKALMTALGSWAELRHDTLLYAKQSYTVTGMADTPYGYVEPYPHVYSRLASLTRMMRDGLESRGLLLEDFESRLTTAASNFEKLAEISVKELQNESILEYSSFIDYVGKSLYRLTRFDVGDDSHEEDRTAVIADVHTDLNSGKVLEVGVGDPYTIYVIVQDHKGNLYLTRGATFSYYEFEHPVTDRLTDEAWHNLLDTNPPDPPEWVQNSLNILLTLRNEKIIGVYYLKKCFLPIT